MATITIRDEAIFYQARGQRGPRVLFVHGAGGTWRNWALQLRDLEGTQRIALDLSGHGRSDGEGRRSIAAYGEDVVRVLDALEWPAATVVGHSMGGAIALWLARHVPDRVERLGLIGTGARLRVHPDILEGLQADDPTPTLRLIVEQAYRPDASAQELERALREFRSTPIEVVHSDYAACDAFDMIGDLDTITQPALVLTGERDRLTPPKYAEYLVEHLPDATLKLVSEAGHFVMLERPEVTTRALADFLSIDR